RRRSDDGDAPGRRHHVRRLPHARHGPARQSGCEGPLHVRRRAPSAARDQDDARRDTSLRRSALAEPARARRPRPWPQGRPPRDRETLVSSARKTGYAIVLDEGHESYGATAELAAIVGAEAFYDLDAPVRRMGALDVPVPFSPVLEDETVPTAATVAEAVREL